MTQRNSAQPPLSPFDGETPGSPFDDETPGSPFDDESPGSPFHIPTPLKDPGPVADEEYRSEALLHRDLGHVLHWVYHFKKYQ